MPTATSPISHSSYVHNSTSQQAVMGQRRSDRTLRRVYWYAMDRSATDQRSLMHLRHLTRHRSEQHQHPTNPQLNSDGRGTAAAPLSRRHRPHRDVGSQYLTSPALPRPFRGHSSEASTGPRCYRQAQAVPSRRQKQTHRTSCAVRTQRHRGIVRALSRGSGPPRDRTGCILGPLHPNQTRRIQALLLGGVRVRSTRQA